MRFTNMCLDWSSKLTKPKKEQVLSIDRADQLMKEYKTLIGLKKGNVIPLVMETPLDISFVGNKISNIKIRKWGPGRPTVYTRETIPPELLIICINLLEKRIKQWKQ